MAQDSAAAPAGTAGSRRDVSHRDVPVPAGAGPAANDRDAPPAYHPLLPVLGCVLLGATLDRLGRPPWQVELAAAVVFATAWWRAFRRRRPRAALTALLCLTAATAAFAHHRSWWLADAGQLHAQLGDEPAPVVFAARVVAIPRDGRGAPPAAFHGKRRLVWRVAIQSVRQGRRWTRSRGRAELKMMLDEAQPTPSLHVGDAVRVFGEASRYPPAVNPGDWDPRQTPATRQLIVVRVRPTGIQRLRHRPWSAGQQLWRLREAVASRLQRWVARGQANLAAALLLGRRDALTYAERETFIAAGIAHLLALSGLHVGLVASGAWALGRIGWLSRRASCVAASASALAYLVIAGPRPSLIRAAVLIVAFAWARWLGRPRSVWNALAAAALLLAAIEPAQLFDTGAQLSFLAVAALCHWGTRPRRERTPLERLIYESRPWWRRALRTTAWLVLQCLVLNAIVWTITAPVAAWRFGRLAPIGILLNPLAGPLVSVALYSLLLLLLLASLPGLEVLAAWPGAVAGWSLEQVAALAGAGGSVPGGHWDVVRPPAAWAAAGCAVWLGWAMARLPTARWWLAAATVAWLAWGAGWQRPAAQDGLTITVLAVGHGSCVVIRTPRGRVWLCDAGRLGGGARVHRSLQRSMERRRERRLDRIVITHEDVDHFNAVARILQTSGAGEIVVGPRMLRKPPSKYPQDSSLRTLAEAVGQQQVAIRRVAEGDTWRRDGVRVEVLHPPRDWELGEADNADSLVLRISYLGCSVLLTGDLEGPGLHRLLQRRLRATVLLAPHHGSPRSRPLQLARHCRARWLIVSSGYRRKELASTRHLSVLQTAEHGALQVRIDEAGTAVRAWRRSAW